jgi:hypothetical protein
MTRLKGSCHCGNISYVLHWPDDGSEIPVRSCSCTFCAKHGGTYTSHRAAELEAVVENERLVSRYRFGTGTAEFYVCSRCGTVPFVTSEIRDHLYAVVNVRTFEGIDPGSFRRVVTDFDGETVEDRLERRSRTWIPRVVIQVRGSSDVQ